MGRCEISRFFLMKFFLNKILTVFTKQVCWIGFWKGSLIPFI